ncbi:MAG TPA: response regulator transcription factor [Luteimonas sp.]|nr:response regulator transcription factor [Luteimonas sp.]
MADGAEPCILVVEDDPGMRENILIPGLQDAGFIAVGAGSAAETYRKMLTHDFALFVLDIGLPDEDGLSLAKHLRTLTDAGIVMLTGRGRKADRIRGLEEGADAYVTKPVDIDVLAATLRSLLRRLPKSAKAALRTWRLDVDNWNLASPAGRQVRLTHPERLVVSLLAQSPGETVAREAIISRLTRDIHGFDPHRLEMLIHRLRRKVLSATNEPLPLNAVRGVGYVLLPA